MPHAVMRLIEATDRERSTAAEIEKIIFEDQSLAARLLAVTNSAAFGLAGRVDSVARAVVILGFQRVRSLAMSLAAMSIFKSRVPRVREEQNRLWRHSFATATTAQAIGKLKGFSVEDSELAYLGGLMHDMGKLFLLTYFETPYFAIKERATDFIQESKFEVGVFGVDHAAMGMQLAKQWNFPLTLVQTVGRHEGPFKEVWSPGIFAVHAASRISHWLVMGGETGELVMDPTVSNWLEDERILEQVIEVTRQAAQGFDVSGML